MDLLKSIGEEKNLTSSQREKDKLHKRNKMRTTQDFSWEAIEAKGLWSKTFNVPREKQKPST